MNHSAINCNCESCRAVRQLWADAAAAEDPERLLLSDGNGDPGFSERTKSVILRHERVVTPFFHQKLSMHSSAISVEEELGALVRQMEHDNGNADIEIKEVRTGSDEIKRFEVTVKRPELEDK